MEPRVIKNLCGNYFSPSMTEQNVYTKQLLCSLQQPCGAAYFY